MVMWPIFIIAILSKVSPQTWTGSLTSRSSHSSTGTSAHSWYSTVAHFVDVTGLHDWALLTFKKTIEIKFNVQNRGAWKSTGFHSPHKSSCQASLSYLYPQIACKEWHCRHPGNPPLAQWSRQCAQQACTLAMSHPHNPRCQPKP